MKLFKVRAMRLSPFATTVFLDNDATLLPRSIRGLDRLADRLARCHQRVRGSLINGLS